jgi:hypothetical protein
MTELSIAPVFISDISKILQDTWNNRRYKITPSYDGSCLNIGFDGYYVKNYDLKIEDIDNPDLSDSFSRNTIIDFRMLYQGTKSGDYKLSLMGYWRTYILIMEYTQREEKFVWLNDNGQKITCPCSDGKAFELMAPQLHNCVQMHFKSKIEMGLFAFTEESSYEYEPVKPEEEPESESDPKYDDLMYRIKEKAAEQNAMELFKQHPRFQRTARFMELTNRGTPLTDDEWIEVELLWADLCQRQGNPVTPFNRQKIIDSWQ